MIHITPTFGNYYHGFFNTHSVLFESMAYFNKYVVEDLSYVYDINSENLKFTRFWRLNIARIKDTPLKNQNLRFFWQYFKSVLFGNERPMSLIHVVLRKTNDSDFIFPSDPTIRYFTWKFV